MVETGLTISEAERHARLRLLRADAVGPATFHAVLARFGSAISALRHWSDIARRLRKSGTPALPSVDSVRREIDAIRAFGANLIAHDEPGYSRMLAGAEPCPPFLIVKGRTELLAQPAIAVVGSRNASAIGQRFARTIATDLGAAGFAVVSGLARGIDTAAHKGSIETGTIAVMAGGLDVVYPPENARLHIEIAERGLLVSEVTVGQQPTAQHFPRRNRIVSGLAQGVLVVEATLHSGSLITARLAVEQGRDVFAVPGSPLDPRASGTNALLRQGAILTESAEDIITELTICHRQPTPARQPAPTRRPPREAEGEEAGLQSEILARLSRTPVETDELVRLTGAPPAAVAAALLDLEFAGLLTRHHGQRVALSDSG
jgi:DNA processing protein